MGSKTCTKCQVQKPLEEFYPKNARCRACVIKITGDYQKAHREQCNERGRRRYKKDQSKFAARSRAWRKKNPEKIRAIEQAYKLRAGSKIKAYRKSYRLNNKSQVFATMLRVNYGITPEDWARLYHAQGGKCGGCARPFDEIVKGACVDHCHSAGTVRGLLCDLCNKALGCARDNPTTLRQLAEYLEVHQSGESHGISSSKS